MKLTDENLNKIWSMLRVEYDLNKSMKDFGFDEEITISDFTRSLPPKIRADAFSLFEKMDEEKK